MNITIKTIPHAQQRYATCGDWKTARGQLRSILASDVGVEDFAFLVAVHELLEAYLCTKRGITQKAVDVFDMAYEQNRPEGNTDEPGDDPAAPYHHEHVFASRIERELAEEMGVDWDAYERAILAL